MRPNSGILSRYTDNILTPANMMLFMNGLMSIPVFPTRVLSAAKISYTILFHVLTNIFLSKLDKASEWCHTKPSLTQCLSCQRVEDYIVAKLWSRLLKIWSLGMPYVSIKNCFFASDETVTKIFAPIY